MLYLAYTKLNYTTNNISHTINHSITTLKDRIWDSYSDITLFKAFISTLQINYCLISRHIMLYTIYFNVKSCSRYRQINVNWSFLI